MDKKLTSEERLKFWQDHVSVYRKSGMTQREYCGKANISYWSFNVWKRRIDSEEKATGIHEIPQAVVQRLSRERKDLEIIVHDRLRIVLPEGFSEKTLCRVLSLLKVRI
ncbi:hypothetical protein KJ644_05515 [Candidatus Dependentiae bacterium]|nr:hypothetical protein [Candidatus Dependentiae bacterium]